MSAVPIVFGINVYNEPAAQLDWCLRHLRRANPEEAVFVVQDGGQDPGLRAVCERWRGRFIGGERLKLLEHGCRWWHRFFSIALSYDFRYCFKMDPDTCLHRPFGSFPQDLDVFGNVERECDIQGGLQGFGRSAAERILGSGVCLDPAYRDLASWGHQITRNYTRYTGQISTDHSMAHIVHRLGLKWGEWPEVDCQWRAVRPFREGVAATHPHKLETRPQSLAAS